MNKDFKTMITTAMAVAVALIVHKVVTKMLNMNSAQDSLNLASGGYASASGDITPCLGANTPELAPHTCESVCEFNGGTWSADVGGQFGGCIGGSVGQFGYGYGSKKLMRR